MSILLYRVDERLIHGQVVIGWGNQLRPDRYLVVDDALVGSDWEMDLYRLAVPEGCEVEFHAVEEARTSLPTWATDTSRSILLTRDVASMLGLGQGGGLEGADVNLGGIHYGPGRDEVLNYIFVDEGDRERLARLVESGAHVSARDLPGSHRVPLDELIG